MKDDLTRQLIARLMGELNEEPLAVSLAGTGSSSRVYKISTDRNHYALRLGRAENQYVCPEMDSLIRKVLLERGGRVSMPIHHWRQGDQSFGKQHWNLDLFVEGFHPQRAKLSRSVCQQLGRTLARLHELPVEGFGYPMSAGEMTILGGQRSHDLAIAERFENLLLQKWTNDFVHPLFSRAPDLEEPVLNSLVIVLDHSRHAEGVLCHGDLHEKQLLCVGNQLAALLDFGKSAILNPYWDFGSFIYFHNITQFSWVAEAYAEISGGPPPSAELAKQYSLAIAMHHCCRARLPGKEHRINVAEGRVRALFEFR